MAEGQKSVLRMEFSGDLTLTALTQQCEGYSMTMLPQGQSEIQSVLSGELILKYFKSSSLLASYREQCSRSHHQKAVWMEPGHVEGSELCNWLVTVDGRALLSLLRLLVKMWLPVGKLLQHQFLETTVRFCTATNIKQILIQTFFFNFMAML